MLCTRGATNSLGRIGESRGRSCSPHIAFAALLLVVSVGSVVAMHLRAEAQRQKAQDWAGNWIANEVTVDGAKLLNRDGNVPPVNLRLSPDGAADYSAVINEVVVLRLDLTWKVKKRHEAALESPDAPEADWAVLRLSSDGEELTVLTERPEGGTYRLSMRRAERFGSSPTEQ